MDTFFFWLSKLVWLVISPDSLLLILILVSFALLFFGMQRAGRRLLGFVCVVLLVIAFVPLHNLLLYPLESRFVTNPELPRQVDGIIVLSGAEKAYLSSLWDQVELGPAAERNLAFVALARQYPQAKLIFAGGSGKLTKQDYKDADVAARLFEQLGMDITRIVFEKTSRNTFENALFAKRLIQPNKAENWILITTAWHMPRSVGAFCKQQWPVIPYPVDHVTPPGSLLSLRLSLAGHLTDLKIAVKEWVGLFAYFLTGKTTALLPSQCEWPEVDLTVAGTA